MAKKQMDGQADMVALQEKAEAWNKDFPAGTEVAAVLDDSTRAIRWVCGAAVVVKDGVEATVCDEGPEKTDLALPINRIRKRAVETRKGKDQLRVDLSDAERLEMGDKLADLYQQATGLEGELAQAKKQIQGKIEAAKNAIESTSNLLRAGYEIRAVPVETVRDFDLQTVVKRRKDTGAVIEKRAMREDELQTEAGLFPELHQEPDPDEKAAVDERAADEAAAEAEETAGQDETRNETVKDPPPFDVGEQEIQKAVEVLKETRRASVSGFQRRLNISFIRAAQIMEALEARGIVGPAKSGGGTRDIVEDALESEQ